jgi:hypothetical protein
VRTLRAAVRTFCVAFFSVTGTLTAAAGMMFLVAWPMRMIRQGEISPLGGFSLVALVIIFVASLLWTFLEHGFPWEWGRRDRD